MEICRKDVCRIFRANNATRPCSRVLPEPKARACVRRMASKLLPKVRHAADKVVRAGRSRRQCACVLRDKRRDREKLCRCKSKCVLRFADLNCPAKRAEIFRPRNLPETKSLSDAA